MPANPAHPIYHRDVPRVLRWGNELDASLGGWESLPHLSPDTEPALFKAALHAGTHVIGPYVIVSEGSTDAPAAALFGRLERQRLRVKVGFATVLQLRATVLCVPQDGVVGPSDDVMLPLVDEALGALGRGDADAVRFYGVREGSVLERRLSAVESRPRPLVSPPVANYDADVSCTFPAFLSRRGSRARESIRRSLRKFASAEAGLVVRRSGQDVAGEALRTSIDRIAAVSYQSAIGVGFGPSPLRDQLLGEGVEQGWYRVWLAERAGVPIAFWSAFCFDSTWTLHETGFDAAFADLAPGVGLLGTVVTDACEDADVSRIGFGSGDAQYKRYWSDSVWMSRNVEVLRPRPKWIAFAAANRSSRWAVRRVADTLGQKRVERLRSHLIGRRVRRTARGRG